MTSIDEEQAVRELGERIGFGRMMQLGERLWRENLGRHEVGDLRGGEFSVGPAVASLVPCPHPDQVDDGHCVWCCGSGRVTKRVLASMQVKR
ncbi:hypothetical protein AB7M45_007751 [Bradyrhizobium elkanii]|uniref:hypothetical protein n=1 Tax=Bradyrhizobium elkanii TaxID=29448 RepID=UPI000919CABE|nr:hypothetical protein [Bradyrhizobium elkanii]MCW2194978.1 hypothetical protein [Bradyrhizobium elkanii]NWL67323.1 hypothetical protein [Bradyrhizobium elkanii]OIM93812.1 hypothetical protein BLN97_14155 [Bradyrhizobium elkanii]